MDFKHDMNIAKDENKIDDSNKDIIEFINQKLRKLQEMVEIRLQKIENEIRGINLKLDNFDKLFV